MCVFGGTTDRCPPTGGLARKRHKKLVAAVRTAHAGESFTGVAALQIIQDRLADHGSPKPVPGLKTVGIDPLELLVVFLNQPVQRRIPRLARAVEGGILTVDNAHRESLKRNPQ
jgi:hypothetical protein